jgi:asparagine synthase (glutamine-hydrolysing)
MCGIWASIGVAAPRRVIEIVAHRGPDGEGWERHETPAGPLCLGHRRLAIIAIDESGRQPMSYGGRYHVVYNGEIYNYRELRGELERLGFAFRTLSDTEVLLAAYAAWGVDCLDRFNGMFAFVLYDAATARLFAARDRFGVKPLYFRNDAGGLAFASEIKQFTAMPGFEARLNHRRAADFLGSGLFDHTSETLFRDVFQLRGGERLSLDLARWKPGDAMPVESWYRLPRADRLELSLDAAAPRFHELLRDSVRLRLRADVAVGSCLSGGLDSSAIVCLVHDLLRGGPGAGRHTVSCVFDDAGIDERGYVEAVVEQTGATSHLVTPSARELQARLEDLVWHQDEPFGSTGIFAQWSVFAEAARQGVRVMLDGQGADELMGGYHSMLGAALGSLLARGALVGMAREALAIRRRHRSSWFRLGATTAAAVLPAAFFWRLARLAGRGRMPAWLAPDFAAAAEATVHEFFHGQREGGETPLGALCRHQLLVSSVPMLLHYEDRNSMAHGVEARVPFLDYRLAEFCIALGARHKLVDGETKTLMRRGLAGILPEKVRLRQDKLGFPTPEARWLRGDLRDWVRAGIDDTLALYPGCFDAARLRRMTDDALSGDRPINAALWRVFCFGAWGRRFGVQA